MRRPRVPEHPLAWLSFDILNEDDAGHFGMISQNRLSIAFDRPREHERGFQIIDDQNQQTRGKLGSLPGLPLNLSHDLLLIALETQSPAFLAREECMLRVEVGFPNPHAQSTGQFVLPP